VFRIGSGHDSHRLVPDRPLILGGVTVPYSLGLYGHSDADVVLHAITDALLGALGLGDIGDAYPDTDPQWQGADSRIFLRETLTLLQARHGRIANFDVTIFAEKPKLGPIKEQIRSTVATLLEITPEQVCIKAKTGEKVGPIGRGEAMACHAVVLVEFPGANG
jgi:2-C-methyl-D-erythritol 2,4-cyclodiphosphate synthase